MPVPIEELCTLGNRNLLRLPKTAFFCSRSYPSSIERPTYLWALEQRMLRRCVLSGFHSQLEQAVFRYLRQGHQQPIVYALARGIQPSLSWEYGKEIEEGRLLFLSAFDAGLRMVTKETATLRNLLMVELADELFVPYTTPGGGLEKLLSSPAARRKPLLTLDLPVNKWLLQRGARIYQPTQLLGHSGLPAFSLRPRPYPSG
jgi:hypothetical protein